MLCAASCGVLTSPCLHLMQQIVSGSDVVVGAGERAVAGAAQAVTASATSASLTDTVTTLLFFAAVAALSAITLGVCIALWFYTDSGYLLSTQSFSHANTARQVLYLTITSWFDDRREKEDRDKYDQGAAATRCAATSTGRKHKSHPETNTQHAEPSVTHHTGVGLPQRRAPSQRPPKSQFPQEAAAKGLASSAASVLQQCLAV